MTQQNDANPEETKEWLDALIGCREEGIDRAHFLIDKLNDTAIRMGQCVPITSVVTPYSNTIAPIDEERMPGDMFMDGRSEALCAGMPGYGDARESTGWRNKGPHFYVCLRSYPVRRRVQLFL